MQLVRTSRTTRAAAVFRRPDQPAPTARARSSVTYFAGRVFLQTLCFTFFQECEQLIRNVAENSTRGVMMARLIVPRLVTRTVHATRIGVAHSTRQSNRQESFLSRLMEVKALIAMRNANPIR